MTRLIDGEKLIESLKEIIELSKKLQSEANNEKSKAFAYGGESAANDLLRLIQEGNYNITESEEIKELKEDLKYSKQMFDQVFESRAKAESELKKVREERQSILEIVKALYSDLGDIEGLKTIGIERTVGIVRDFLGLAISSIKGEI